MNNSVWEKRRKRLFELIEIGSNYDCTRDVSEPRVIWRFDGGRYLTIQMRSDISFLYNLLIDVLLIYMLQFVSVNNDSVLSCLQQF